MRRALAGLGVGLFVVVLAWNALADKRATSSAATPTTCHVRGHGLFVLPDPRCTPGAVDARVAQANIARTICKPGWTDTVRPAESMTEPIKRRLIRAYGDYAGRHLSRYELDHDIPLELGGDPGSATDTRNLWPEVDYSSVSPGSYDRNPKDRLERILNLKVCRRQMTLAAARRLIASDWVSAYRRYVR
jgi:hypothetical protein